MILCNNWNNVSIAAGAAALALAASAAKADVVAFSGYGTPAANTALVTDFSTNNGLSGLYLLATGTSTVSAAPAFSATTNDAAQYLAVSGGQSATLALGSLVNEVSVYIGSLDSYDGISFSNGSSFSGSLLATLTGAVASGDQHSGNSNGLFTFDFTTAVDSVTFSSSADSIEVASVSDALISAAPETSTWAMLVLGFATLGFAGVRPQRAARKA